MVSKFCTEEQINKLRLSTEQGAENPFSPVVYFSTPLGGKREFVPHHHTELELSYIVSGNGTYTLADKQYEIHSGDIFTFSNDELHKITFIDSKEPMVLFNVKFLPRLLWDGQQDNSDLYFLNMFWNRGINFSHRTGFGAPKYQAIVSEFSNILAEKDNNFVCCDIMIKYYIIKILVLMSRHLGYIDINPEKVPVSSRDSFYAVNLATDYIEKHFAEDIRLRELCSKFAMSQNSFTSSFKALNGITPKNYINSKRIDKSVKLLKNTDLSVLDIALECGYNSTAGFNKIFLKTIGKTPSEYRRAYASR